MLMSPLLGSRRTVRLLVRLLWGGRKVLAHVQLHVSPPVNLHEDRGPIACFPSTFPGTFPGG